MTVAWLSDAADYARRDTSDCTIEPGDPEAQRHPDAIQDDLDAVDAEIYRLETQLHTLRMERVSLRAEQRRAEAA